MTTPELIGWCLASAVGGSSVLAVYVRLKGQRALSTDQKLWKRVDTLEKKLDSERDDCERKIALVHERLDRAEQAQEECEKGRAKLEVQLNRLRSWMRTDPSEREDLTPVEPVRERKHR